MAFKPEEHMMEIKNKNGSSEYLPVQWRLVWANEECPELKITIVEKVIDPDREVTKEVYQWNNETRRSEKIVKKARGWAYVHVRVEDGKGKVGEAIKVECAVDFEDYTEKADTGATGRALAKIGWGTQFAPDLDEQHRIVDAPVTYPEEKKAQSGQPPVGEMAPSVKQWEDLRLLCRHLGKQIAKPKTASEAKKLIAELQAEYDTMVAKGRAS